MLAVWPGSSLARRAADLGLPLAPVTPRAGLPGQVLALLRVVDRVKPAVLHAHTARDHSLALLAAYLRPGLPLVVHRRVDFPVATNRISRAKYLSPRVDLFLAVSRAVAGVLVEGGVPEARVEVVYSAVPTPAPVPEPVCSRLRAEAGLQAGQVPVAVIGSLVPHKGHRFLIDAIPQVVRHAPALRVLVIGDRPLRSQLGRRVTRLGLESHVRFLGQRPDARSFLAIAGILVAPSHQEGLNTTILDAFQYGCPVVAATAGGIAETVTPATGWPVPPANPNALAEALVAALENPSECRERAQRARALVNARHGVSGMVEATARAYDRAVDRRRASEPF